jgi:hypothetical protein
MKGLSPDTEFVFNSIKRFEIFKDYILIGGTALSVQIDHRLSEDLVRCCGTYSRHRMKSKTILSILSNSSLFKYEENFELLEPRYMVNSKDIEAYMRSRILKEFSFRSI